MNPFLLYKPDEKIKWIGTVDPNRQYIITIFLTEKYDDIRFFNINDTDYINLWKKEMLSQQWIQIDNIINNDIINQIIADKTPVFDKNTLRYENSLDETEIKKLYDTYKIEND